MVKPRVFVSSTYYDLKPIREVLEKFIDSLGYEPVIFENGSVTHTPGQYLDLSCYSEVKECHILVLLIGGRYGSPASGSENTYSNENNDEYESITVKEYQTAHIKGIPIYVFIEKSVLSAYKFYNDNKNTPNVTYRGIENKNIFKFIDKIYSLKIYWVKEFDKTDDITNELKKQWAGLFAKYLRNMQNQKELSSISAKIDELSQVSETLRTYTESLMKKVKPEGFDKIIQDESNKIEDANKRKTFFEHYLPDIIMDRAKEAGLKISKDDIYTAYIQTDKFDDFLRRLGFDKKSMKGIMDICFYYDGYFELDLLLKPELHSNEDSSA